MLRTLLIFLCAVMWYAPATYSQISTGGLVDLELRKGGEDSAPIINQTPGSKLTLYTPSIRIFVDGFISEKWLVNSVLQADHYTGETLSPVFFSVLSVNWFPIDGSDLTVSAGRFVLPYGLYSERVLSSQNPFVHLPLSHARNLPVDKRRGFYPGELGYEGFPGQSMVYQRMYNQGLLIANSTGESRLFTYQLAATLSAASSHFEVGMHNTPAFTGRLTFNPALWLRFGGSFSRGPFMKRSHWNADISDAQLASYRQTLLGSDVVVSFLYYSIAFEYNRSNWNTPYIDSSGNVIISDHNVAASHYSGEFVFSLPFLPGAHTAFRMELLQPEEVTSYQPQPQPLTNNWIDQTRRMEFAAAYRFNRSVIFKASWLVSAGRDQALDENVISAGISAGF